MGNGLNERLKELLSERGESPEAFAAMLGISRRTVSSWLYHPVDLKFRHLIKICLYFNCSIDFLAGRREEPEPLCNLANEKFHEIFNELLYSHKTNVYKVADDLNFTHSNVYKWVNGRTRPTLYSLIKLADYFQIPVDWLVA